MLRALVMLGLLSGGGSGFASDRGKLPVREVIGVHGRPANPFSLSAGAKLIVFIFTRTDCPISNRYAPEIERLRAEFSARNVAFWLVYTDPDEKPADVREHLDAYEHACGAVLDPRHNLVKLARVSTTPEAAVFRPDGELLYHGRIDDRYADYGKMRPSPTRRELAEGLTLALSGKPIPPAGGPAIGCLIEAVQP